MNGQWIGTYGGTNQGGIIVNVDERRHNYVGMAYINDASPQLPRLAVFFETPDKANKTSFTTNSIGFVSPKDGTLQPWEEIREHYAANLVVPTGINVFIEWTSTELKLFWRTNIGSQGSCTLPATKANTPSQLVASKLSWEDFKRKISEYASSKYLFRGQNSGWRLRTAFHRTGRAEIRTFLREDIRALHQHLSALTKHIFRLEVADENGAFLCLAQHHGYPTPLLDWTLSPFVAAFFAYRGISAKTGDAAKAEEHVRVYAFDIEKWQADFHQLNSLDNNGPHVSIGNFLAIENNRMISQQAVSLMTNIDDIESYILLRETESKRYLHAYDIPVLERQTVMHDLQFMGITAGSIFPGLDGTCEALKERNFQSF